MCSFFFFLSFFSSVKSFFYMLQVISFFEMIKPQSAEVRSQFCKLHSSSWKWLTFNSFHLIALILNRLRKDVLAAQKKMANSFSESSVLFYACVKWKFLIFLGRSWCLNVHTTFGLCLLNHSEWTTLSLALKESDFGDS